ANGVVYATDQSGTVSAFSLASVQPPTTTVLGSSANPADAGTSVVLTATVTGVAPGGNVNFSEGGVALAGCAAVALAGGGNAPSATCASSSLSVGSHAIVASYSGDAGNAGSTSNTLLQVIDTASGGTNVALASSGAVALASSVFSSQYPVAAVNNNDRKGAAWANGGGWNDATANAFPDWVEIDFNGSKTLDQVIVYTLQDNYPNPIEPTDTLTFAQYGVTAFNVQGWTGSTWTTLATISSNNLVKRAVTFSPFITARIRVNVTSALLQYSRLVEVEAWGTAAVGPPPSSTTLASSLNPSTVGASVTFTATVTGTNPTGSVALTDGGNAISGCTGLALTGSGNARTAACTTSALSQGTHSIVAAYAGDAGNAGSSSSPLSQLVNAAGSSNVALASNGAVASASSTISAAYPVSAVNNNERAGLNWGNGGGWNDATGNAFPDTVQIAFNGSKTINRVVLYTLQDNYASPVEPTDTMTFSLYGITAFTVQGLTGSTWKTLATISGNNLVKRTVTFASFTTSRIRLRVTNALASFSRITEIEAWGN
ncbi:MAG TPA: Ig-like domain repeat protein, partial [Rhodanobacter sp.]